MTRLLDAQGLEISHEGHRTRLKWHRLRKRFADPLFSAAVMAEGFAAGASMELDLRVRADGGFVVLHDEELEGETTGHGPIAEKSMGDLSDIRMQEGDRPLILSEDLAAMMQSTHPAALLQFDMKDDYEAIGARGIEHLAAHFRDIAASVIVSGGSLDLIVAVKEKLPHLLRGIDPTGKLYDIRQAGGWKAVEMELRADLRGPTEPDTIYLHWPLILDAANGGLDMIGLCQDEGKRVDAWTFTLRDPEAGFSEEEWRNFEALMALKPDQVTTDEAPATERAWGRRMAD
ncbi:glycerophosphoryl diester phosphodiesterase [Rhizobium leguminosarum]|uniref:Glycerophosphoryl diester phosphodiesterase n=1 Tax=Rhizobium leguminosarum TaxID=384 RepID=A0AAE2MQK8_RHILE|nr:MULTISPECIES: glycerophosphodiester phosphodiesterase family protein [Rhizobium]MBB4293642.1 glycerophosphoryl diester phosphodiesterase [Rhizobium leguminosarum]MBB4300299.1 glycerophosphoryl diester phosphodiesterase [Rhizobium leguminosarum]MBB4311570.1 glycerophosphoryl diester phosphodiesterase [Rhizobium leguminosarum]MBB4420385.1 glycerophosphoryl diester phosphodiesterase [Rhizobium leguminosarum]MBB4435724.1 glycerophosphoryl diester phosphodiesterase [Rhizobium esperanzae]